jgi:hypothetical protein
MFLSVFLAEPGEECESDSPYLEPLPGNRPGLFVTGDTSESKREEESEEESEGQLAVVE